MDYRHCTDESLYNLCKTWGNEALNARNKFIALLPEVNRRQLFRKHGFESIFHFAKVMAGVSEEQVRRVLNVDEKFKIAPALKELLAEGEISVNKLAKIASVVNVNNQNFWAMQVQNLSTRAVETLVRDHKKSVHVNTQMQSKSAAVNVVPHLSTEVKEKLCELEKKGIDINNIILRALQEREQKIAEEKAGVAEKIEDDEKSGKVVTRHIPAAAQKIMRDEFGIKCAVPTCNKKSETIHHTNRFSLSKSHNPYYLAPLCKAHHSIAHMIDIKYAIASKNTS